MSYYPDGSSHPNWNSGAVRVVPLYFPSSAFKVAAEQIRAIVCHRVNSAGQEEYLVEWKRQGGVTPYSWHNVNELDTCLVQVQLYIASHETTSPSEIQTLRIPEAPLSRKRKSPDNDNHHSFPTSVSRASPALSYSSTESSAPDDFDDEPLYYNGIPHKEKERITMLCASKSQNVTFDKLPTLQMQQRAARTGTRVAAHKIRGEFDLKVLNFCRNQAPVTVTNQFSSSRPPLNFTFIDKSIPGKGVYVVDPETMLGCGYTKVPGQIQTCRPNMGQSIGCEYSRLCECLEYAAVDTARLKDEAEKELYKAGEVAGLPKRFPYHTPLGDMAGCLVGFYLESRHPIYECNPKCMCGEECKTKVVQKGRTVPLEIFMTEKRGWGLRCTEALKKGQFIDTYRGEIITNDEADRREEQATKRKVSYLYSLDKHVGSNGLQQEDCYVIDGEFMGGPTRFINHSCEPNCRQYTVSYNKNDLKVYELAFFAYKNIPARTELTFDYLDKDEEDEVDSEDEITKGTQGSNTEDMSATICHCGAKKCRGKLWI